MEEFEIDGVEVTTFFVEALDRETGETVHHRVYAENMQKATELALEGFAEDGDFELVSVLVEADLLGI